MCHVLWENFRSSGFGGVGSSGGMGAVERVARFSMLRFCMLLTRGSILYLGALLTCFDCVFCFEASLSRFDCTDASGLTDDGRCCVQPHFVHFHESGVCCGLTTCLDATRDGFATGLKPDLNVFWSGDRGCFLTMGEITRNGLGDEDA